MFNNAYNVKILKSVLLVTESPGAVLEMLPHLKTLRASGFWCMQMFRMFSLLPRTLADQIFLDDRGESTILVDDPLCYI